MNNRINPEQFARHLVQQLNERNNPNFMGIQTGKVVKPFPNIEIALGENIVLDKSMLVFNDFLVKGYKRKFNINTSYTNPKVVGSLQLNSDSDPTQPIVKLTLDTKEDGTSTAEIEFVDELKVGDEVALQPTQNEQTYYVLHKVVRFE